MDNEAAGTVCERDTHGLWRSLASGRSLWIAAGSPRISYAGFQMAFAFFLCVIQGPTPAFDMTTARDRVIGILLGNAVVHLLFTSLWPVSLGRSIDPALAGLLRRLSAMARSTSLATRRSLASQTQAALTAVEGDPDLTEYEPASICPSREWLGVRRQAAREIAALEGPLLLSADGDAPFWAEIADRLDRLADHLALTGGAAAENGGAREREERKAAGIAGAAALFHDLVATHLLTLERSLTGQSQGDGTARDASP